ncbi:5-oxoprolinase subunit PxpA [Chitinasiproducens palmae]|nr:5-oxoprolinase subunit PxpA [Chitinasiproducens palmae]
MSIDLNADLAEGIGDDAALLPLVSSANIACGFHAGSHQLMRRAVELAIDNHVAIGAHPSFDDRANFGRSTVEIAPADAFSLVAYQVGALAGVATAAGGRLAHVKPHGALYNQAARDRRLAEAIVDAVRGVDASLAIFGLAGGELIAAAQRAGMRSVDEVFADRGYCADGTLVPRNQPGALLDSEEEVLRRTLAMIERRGVQSIDGAWVPLQVGTICLHGDGAHAVAFARRLRAAFDAAGIAVRAPESVAVATP